jgi:hypothetical protein
VVFTLQPIERNVAQVGVAIAAQLLRELGAVGQQFHRILGGFRLAECQELAGIRFLALRANGDVWHRTGEIALRGGNPYRDLLLQRQYRVSHVRVSEKTAIVAVARIDEMGVDVGKFDTLDVESGTARHPRLDCRVGHVRVPYFRGGLHLDHPVAAVAADQDVGAHEHIGVTQCWLEQRDVTRFRQHLGRFQQRAGEIAYVRDEPALRMEALRRLADQVALSHPILRRLARLCQLAPERLQPQTLRTLFVCDEPGLRKSHGLLMC